MKAVFIYILCAGVFGSIVGKMVIANKHTGTCGAKKGRI